MSGGNGADRFCCQNYAVHTIHHVCALLSNPIQSNIVESIIGDAIESIREVNIKYIYIKSKGWVLVSDVQAHGMQLVVPLVIVLPLAMGRGPDER